MCVRVRVALCVHGLLDLSNGFALTLVITSQGPAHAGDVVEAERPFGEPFSTHNRHVPQRVPNPSPAVFVETIDRDSEASRGITIFQKATTASHCGYAHQL